MFSQLWNPLSIILPLLFSLTTTIAQGNENSDPLADIFPPLTPFINYGNLMITYGSGFILQGAVNSGIETTPNDTSTAPTTISIIPFEGYGNPFLPVNKSQLYTLVMIDPDAPSRANPTFSEILHFVQTGLTITTGVGDATESKWLGLTATVPPAVSYRGPAPPVDSGLHRYIFLVFKQPDSTVDLGGFSADNRRNFDVHQFARDNRFGEPLAAAYFQAQNEANNNDENNTQPPNPEDDNSDDGDNEDTITGDENEDEDKEEDPSVDGPLVIDTIQPTPPPRKTPGSGGSSPTPVLTEIKYDGTLTHSLSPEMTLEVDGDSYTDSEIYTPGLVDDWTMTIPKDDTSRTPTTMTTVERTLQILTDSISPTATPDSSYPSDEDDDETSPSNSQAGIHEVETSPTQSIPSWLDGVGEEENGSGRNVGINKALVSGIVAAGGALLVIMGL